MKPASLTTTLVCQLEVEQRRGMEMKTIILVKLVSPLLLHACDGYIVLSTL